MNFRNIELKSEFDLIYFDEYRTATECIQKEANELYRKGVAPEEVVKFCEKQTMKDKAQKLKSDSNLGKRFQTRTFENFKAETEEQKTAYTKAHSYAKDIEKHLKTGTGIIFAGKGAVGTGKTHLACAIANDLLERGYPTKVINVTRMIYQIKSDFKVDEYIKVPVLLIDDLGKENSTTWVAETLYFIINERYEAMRPTIITTEYGLGEIGENYVLKEGAKTIDRGKAIVSRLTEDFVYVTLSGKDYRQKRI